MTVFVTVRLEIDSKDVRYTQEILDCMEYGFEYIDDYGGNLILDSEIIEQEIVI